MPTTAAPPADELAEHVRNLTSDDQQLIADSLDVLERKVFRQVVYRIVYRNRRYITTDDALQAARIGVLKAARRFDPNRVGNPAGYVATVARNVTLQAVIHARRKRDAHNTGAISLDYSPSDLDSEHTIANIIVDPKERDHELRLLLRQFLELLPTFLSERERHAYLLAVQGWPLAAIAERLQIALKSVDTALTRARRKLSDLITTLPPTQDHGQRLDALVTKLQRRVDKTSKGETL